MWMLQTLGCFGEQLRSCRQIPVGRGRIYVPKISRKQRETLLRVRTIPVGLQHRVNGERMPLIPHAELEALFRVPDYSAYRSPGAAIPGEYAAKGTAHTA